MVRVGGKGGVRMHVRCGGEGFRVKSYTPPPHLRPRHQLSSQARQSISAQHQQQSAKLQQQTQSGVTLVQTATGAWVPSTSAMAPGAAAAGGVGFPGLGMPLAAGLPPGVGLPG